MEDQLKLKIEAYLGGRMTPEEIIDFETELNNDAQLKSELGFSRQLNHHFKGGFVKDTGVRNSYTEELSVFLKSEEAKGIKQNILEANKEYQITVSVRPKKNKFYLLVAATVALLICVVGFSYFGQTSTSENLYAQYYSKTDLPSVIKREGETSLLQDGVMAYEAGDYLKAITLFDSYEESAVLPFNNSVYVYEGMAEMNLGNFKKALASFDVLIDSNSIDASKGLWFKALTHLKNNDRENARASLDLIVESPANFNYAKAKELLKDL